MGRTKQFMNLWAVLREISHTFGVIFFHTFFLFEASLHFRKIATVPKAMKIKFKECLMWNFEPGFDPHLGKAASPQHTDTF